MHPVSVPRPAPARVWLHLLLFVVTLGTTFLAYLLLFGRSFPFSGGGLLAEDRTQALFFSGSLLAILGSHEMGHYVLARWHKVDTSLPYFIPLPVPGSLGTLGAVIRLRGRIPTRNALVDIGAAGPLAGLVVALPLLYWGLLHSTVVDSPPVPSAFPGESSLWVLGQELLRWVMEKVTQAPPAMEPVYTSHQTHFGDNLLMKALTWLALGPLPEGKDVVVHPVVMAAWFGLLVTLLNLLPVGQLDGGHLTFAALGPRARLVGRGVAVVLLFLTVFVTASWGLWLVVASKVVGFGHPEVLRPEEPLSASRKVICALCLLALVGCAMPIPLREVWS
ncbi:site-2 protease family protein [Corallococcus exiguus]|uniref:site-2 protease family protein n=1 Tax=Corallococcus TaxID=83461 RepID=UPI000EA360A5|nr:MULTISPECIES: site-2 protease family protein [Corallococcus]NRD62422.1 site-2 protease family protein [Corallococcus exiguus]RKH22621.1 site-2 protease family protein [Corallococcus sp. CA041A]RKI03348.1 site-2 protease family protein [Corallococcus sp. AB030]